MQMHKLVGNAIGYMKLHGNSKTFYQKCLFPDPPSPPRGIVFQDQQRNRTGVKVWFFEYYNFTPELHAHYL